MIIRIVRMQFQADQLSAFQAIFDQSKASIRRFPGCLHLELHADQHDPSVRYTYSHWTSEEALNAYRKSDLFGAVWPKTKALFAGKPFAYSLIRLESVSSSPAE
ncbi:MAG: antibiotic biosynthesis monooxygenase family protein [Bacteroidota bacterium]